jgi:chemotaxis protein MotB
MSKKRKGGDHGDIHADERWLITYADMMTLLLAVFIVMYALSDTNLRKFNAFAQSLSSAFNTDVFSGNTSFTISSGQESAPDTGELDSGVGFVGQQAQTIEAVVNDYAIRQGLGDDVSVDQVPEGISIRIVSELIFEPGRARLSEDSFGMLEKIADTIRSTTQDQGIRVVGHTDDTPTSGALYADNFELSAARAMAVMRLLAGSGIAPDRLSLEGAGEYRPLFPNDTEAHRAANRRVDILILYPPSGDPVATGGEEQIAPSLTPVFGEDQ